MAEITFNIVRKQSESDEAFERRAEMILPTKELGDPWRITNTSPGETKGQDLEDLENVQLTPDVIKQVTWVCGVFTLSGG